MIHVVNSYWSRGDTLCGSVICWVNRGYQSWHCGRAWSGLCSWNYYEGLSCAALCTCFLLGKVIGFKFFVITFMLVYKDKGRCSDVPFDYSLHISLEWLTVSEIPK